MHGCSSCKEPFTHAPEGKPNKTQGGHQINKYRGDQQKGNGDEKVMGDNNQNPLQMYIKMFFLKKNLPQTTHNCIHGSSIKLSKKAKCVCVFMFVCICVCMCIYSLHYTEHGTRRTYLATVYA